MHDILRATSHLEMTCMDAVYQNVSSCFPTIPFPAASHAAYSVSGSSSAINSKNAGESTQKKFGSSRMYTDRHGCNSSSSGSRLSESLSSGCGSSSVTSSSRGNMGVTSSYARVGLSISGGSETTGWTSNSTRSGKEAAASFPEEKPPTVQHLTTTQSLIEDYHGHGDAARAVDDHFSRALNPTSYTKCPLPMRSRNLPASFYDPNTTAPVPQQYPTSHYPLPYHGYPSSSTDYAYATDPYYPTSFHPASFQHAPSDWHHAYSSVAAQSFSHRAAAMQMTADISANRFNSSSYNSLISQSMFPTTPVSIRTARMDVAGACKSGTVWPNHAVFGSEMPHYPSAAEYDYSFSGNTPSAKELYWH